MNAQGERTCLLASGSRRDIFFTQEILLFRCLDNSSKGVVVLIAKDEAWRENITKLTQFYFEHLFLKVVEGQL